MRIVRSFVRIIGSFVGIVSTFVGVCRTLVRIDWLFVGMILLRIAKFGRL
jgi:hypothetical protein